MGQVLDSEFFTINEFAISESHPDLAEPVPARYVLNVELLVGRFLDPARYLVNQPFHILSGYRSEKLNDAVGGSPTSQHRRAEAADFTTERIRWIFRAMVARPDPYDLGQVIYYPDRAFVHVALPSINYPTISFHVHWPDKGFKYLPIRGRKHFDDLKLP